MEGLFFLLFVSLLFQIVHHILNVEGLGAPNPDGDAVHADKQIMLKLINIMLLISFVEIFINI